MFRLTFHLIQFAIHCYFTNWNYTFYEERSLLQFWNQIKYLTNFSNIQIFVFVVPFLIMDLKNFKNKNYRYSHMSTLFFQSLNSVIFIVTFMYWFLLWLNPRLLFGDKDHSIFPFPLVFYEHGGNLILMQIEYFLYPQPNINHKDKLLWYFSFTLAYFGVYAIHFTLFNEHVYGFQKLMTNLQLVMMYLTLFLLMFLVDLFYTAIVHKLTHNQEVPKEIKEAKKSKKSKNRD